MRLISWVAFGVACMGVAACGAPPLSATPPAVAPASFNGIITFATRTATSSGTLIEAVSGNQVRIETTDSARGQVATAVIIIDGDARVVTTLIPAQQKYISMTEDQMKAMGALVAAAREQTLNQSPSPNRPMSVVNTGRTETVAGVSCQVYQMTGEVLGRAHDGLVCIADGIGFLAGASTMLTSWAVSAIPAFGQLSELLKGGRGVLKSTETIDGKPTVVLVATKIDRTVPSAAGFEMPPGYTQIQVPKGPLPGQTPQKSAGPQTPP